MISEFRTISTAVTVASNVEAGGPAAPDDVHRREDPANRCRKISFAMGPSALDQAVADGLAVADDVVEDLELAAHFGEGTGIPGGSGPEPLVGGAMPPELVDGSAGEIRARRQMA